MPEDYVLDLTIVGRESSERFQLAHAACDRLAHAASLIVAVAIDPVTVARVATVGAETVGTAQVPPADVVLPPVGLEERNLAAIVSAPEPAEDHAACFVASSSSDPEARAQWSQAVALLDRLLDRLPDKKRAVFVLADIEGLTAPEIAEIVGANARTVYSRLRAARLHVATDLAQYHAHDGVAVRDRLAPQWLRAAASRPRAPAGVQKRVWAALLLQLPDLGSGAIANGLTAGLPLAKAVLTSVALGAALLSGIVVAAGSTRARTGALTREAAVVEPERTRPHQATQPGGLGAALLERLFPIGVPRACPVL